MFDKALMFLVLGNILVSISYTEKNRNRLLASMIDLLVSLLCFFYALFLLMG